MVSCKDTNIQSVDIYPAYFDTTSLSGNPSVTYNGTIYTSSTQVVENLTTINGCDSVRVTNITVNAPAHGQVLSIQIGTMQWKLGDGIR